MRDLLNVVAFSLSAFGAVVSVIATFIARQNSKKLRRRLMTKEGSLVRGADVEESPLSQSAIDKSDEPDEK